MRFTFIAFFAAVLSQGIAAPREYDTIDDLLQLKYGQPCSYEMEEFRQNLTTVLINVAASNPSELTEKLNIVTKDIVRTILAKGDAVCNALELLTCNKETAKCDCGDPGTFAVFGEDVGRTKFVAEGNKCRWSPQSYCLPEEYFKQKNAKLVSVDTLCAKDTKCVATQSGESCTFGTIVNYYLTTGITNAINKTYSGEICSCQEESLKIVTIGGSSDENASVEGGDYQKYQYIVDGDGSDRRRRQAGDEDGASIFPGVIGLIDKIQF